MDEVNKNETTETPAELSYEDALKKFNEATADDAEVVVEEEKKVVPTEAKKEDEEKPDEVLAGYNPEQLSALEKIVGAINKKNGVMTKSEFEQIEKQRNETQVQNTMKGVVESFVKEHPEYAAANDKSGRMRRLLQEKTDEFNTSSPERLKNALSKAHVTIQSHILELAQGKKVETDASVSKEATPSSAGGSPTKPAETSNGDTKQLDDLQKSIRDQMLARVVKKD